MKNPFKLNNYSAFTKNLATLVTGTSLAQALPLLVSPILTRIYSPDDFGILAIFMSVVAILGVVGNLRYELAVLLPEKKHDSINIVALGFIISGILSLTVLVFTLFFHDTFVGLLGEKRLSGWIYLVAPVMLFISMYGMLNYYNTRIKKYKAIAFSKVIKSLVMVSVQLIAGFGKMAFGGLILGYSLSHLFGNIRLFKNYVSDEDLKTSVSTTEIKRMAHRYKRFPIFTFPATLFNKLSSDLPNILISIIFNVTTLGFYSLAVRMLDVPTALVGSSVGQLYMQEAALEKERTGRATETFKSVLKKLIFIGLPFFGLIFLFAPFVFGFVFGDEWRISGVYARYLIPMLFIRFLVGPVSVSLSVFEKQHHSLFIQLGLLLATLLVMAWAWIFGIGFLAFLMVFVVVLAAYYLFFLLILFYTVKGKTS